MMPEEEIVNLAFEVLGSLLITSENASADAVDVLVNTYGLDETVAVEVVSMALERWTEVYDLE
jgi:hypothetical protein